MDNPRGRRATDRRGSARLNLYWPIRATSAAGEDRAQEESTFTVNVGRRGAYMFSAKQWRAGGLVEVRISIPRIDTFDCMGRIARIEDVRLAGGGYLPQKGMAVEFIGRELDLEQYLPGV